MHQILSTAYAYVQISKATTVRTVSEDRVGSTASEASKASETSTSKAMAMQASSGNVFPVGADLLGPDPGTAPDWAYGALGVRATMTVELEDPQHGFCLPSDRIRKVGAEQFAAIMAMMQFLDLSNEPSFAIGPFVTGIPLGLVVALGAIALILLAVAMYCIFEHCARSNDSRDVFSSFSDSDLEME